MTGDWMEDVEGADGAQGDCLLQGPEVVDDACVPVAASVHVKGSSSFQEAPFAVRCTSVLPLPETLELGFSHVADLAQMTVEPDPSGTATEDRGGAIPRLSDVTASFCSGSSTVVLPLPGTLKLGFSDVADLAQMTVEPDLSGDATKDRGGAIPKLSDVTASFCSGSSPPTGAPTVCATLGLGFPGSPVPVSVEGCSPVLGAPEPFRLHEADGSGGVRPEFEAMTADFVSGGPPSPEAPTVCASREFWVSGFPDAVPAEGSSPGPGAPNSALLRDLQATRGGGVLSSGGSPLPALPVPKTPTLGFSAVAVSAPDRGEVEGVMFSPRLAKTRQHLCRSGAPVRQPELPVPTGREFHVFGGAKRPWEGPLSPPRPKPFHSFMVAWDPACAPCHESSFLHDSPVLGSCPAPVTESVRWPPLLREMWSRTSLTSLQSAGTSVQQWQEFVAELQNAGASVPPMTMHPCRMAAACQDDPDSAFLVRGAACGVGFPFSPVPADTFYTVSNYVADDQWSAMQKEIVKEKSAGNVVAVQKHWKVQGFSAVGIVEKERKGVVKFRPVWDYSRPEEVGVNARIDLRKEEFSSVRTAYSLLRPGYWLAKVDLTAAYRSVPVAAQYWMAHAFRWDGEDLVDTRAPFGNSAMPGIFTRFTRAIVRWMQAQGACIVGYLDDFLLIGKTQAETHEWMLLLREFVCFLGFTVNDDKCEGPFQCLEFLGVVLSTEGETCTASISEDRILTVQTKIAELKALWGLPGPRVPRSKMEALLGLLAFCGQVVHGLSLYTRHAHALLSVGGLRRSKFLHLTDKVIQDLKVVVQILRMYNGRKVRLDRPEIKWEWFSTDASTGVGMGAVLDGRWFAVTWAWLRQQPQESYFPFNPKVKESYDIGYLELFTVFWALVLWGKFVQGKTVVIQIDNNCVIGQLESWWGPGPYIPLLREVFLVCVQYDIRLLPTYISSKANVWADLLSRGELLEFRRRFRADRQVRLWRKDRDDWMLLPSLWHPLDVQFGPFSVDCCVSPFGANSFCRLGWTKEDDARVQDFAGHNSWGNLPFSDFVDILRNFLRCKRRQQLGTAGTFLVPCWPGNPGFELVLSLPGVFRVVRRWGKSSTLFTAPSLSGGGRTYWGDTDWPVLVVHCPPSRVSWTDNPWTGDTGVDRC